MCSGIRADKELQQRAAGRRLGFAKGQRELCIGGEWGGQRILPLADRQRQRGLPGETAKKHKG